MFKISVSAKLIRFPTLCCCCAGAEPTGKYEAAFTRTTGKRVIKADRRSWEFPLCGACSLWIRADRLRQRLLMASIFSALIFFACLNIQIQNPSNDPTLSILMGVISGLLIFGWRKSAKRSYKIKPASQVESPPVTYDGWQGSVHTFHIANSGFYERFKELNAQKLVG